MTWKFLTIALVLASPCFAQKPLVIKGALKVQGTNNSVPFGSIAITNSTRGTAANDQGEFLIEIREADRSEKLRVSCIGFKTRLLSIDSIKNVRQVVVSLESDVSLLDEVVIREAPLNPGEILKKATESIGDNYLKSPFNIEYYSEIIATDTISREKFKVETVSFGYSHGYSSVGQRSSFEILHRRATGEDLLSEIDYDYWPTYEIHRADELSRAFSHGVLNLKNIDKFKLSYSGVSLFDEDTVYTIDYYAVKPTKEITGYGIVPKVYKGKISITTNTHAIVKHEITTDNFSFLIIYKRIEGKFYPYFITGKRKLFKSDLPVSLTNSITLKSIELKNVKVVGPKTNEFRHVGEVKFDEEFWNAHYPIGTN